MQELVSTDKLSLSITLTCLWICTTTRQPASAGPAVVQAGTSCQILWNIQWCNTGLSVVGGENCTKQQWALPKNYKHESKHSWLVRNPLFLWEFLRYYLWMLSKFHCMFWPGNRTFLEVASMVVTRWIEFFFAQFTSATEQYCSKCTCLPIFTTQSPVRKI